MIRELSLFMVIKWLVSGGWRGEGGVAGELATSLKALKFADVTNTTKVSKVTKVSR